jgi:hypothetical protein
MRCALCIRRPQCMLHPQHSSRQPELRGDPTGFGSSRACSSSSASSMRRPRFSGAIVGSRGFSLGCWSSLPRRRSTGFCCGAGTRAVACLLPWMDVASIRPVRPGGHRRRGAVSRLSVRPYTSGQNLLARGRPLDGSICCRSSGAVLLDAVADSARVRTARDRPAARFRVQGPRRR